MDSCRYYRKKPSLIRAAQLTRENAVELAEWCGGGLWQRYNFGKPQTKVIVIETLEGAPLEAVEGDYIIEAVEGEFYPCAATIFWETYEGIAL